MSELGNKCAGCGSLGKNPHNLDCLIQHFMSYSHGYEQPDDVQKDLARAYTHGYEAGKDSHAALVEALERIVALGKQDEEHADSVGDINYYSSFLMTDIARTALSLAKGDGV